MPNRNPITARWEDGVEHDARSIELYNAIAKIDFATGDFFGFKSGGDGDNGEHLMYLLDEHFEAQDGPDVFDEIQDNAIVFNLNPDGTHPAAAEKLAQRFLKESGRTLVSVDGNNDRGFVRYVFTPEMEYEDAEEWDAKVKEWL